MNLEEIFAALKALLAKDEKLSLFPFIGQVASAPEDVEKVGDYNKQLEDALRDPGLALVAVVAEGELASDLRAPVLDLENTVMLSVVENTKKNATGLTAFQVARRAMRVIHQGRVALRGARADFRLSKPAFNLGPLNQGTTVYFINLSVRTTEELGALDPV